MKTFNSQVREAFQTAREESVHHNDTSRRLPAYHDSQFKQTGPVNIWKVKNSKSLNIKLSNFLGHTEQIGKQVVYLLGKEPTPFQFEVASILLVKGKIFKHVAIQSWVLQSAKGMILQPGK